jgi:hypothetical protein
MMTKFILVSLTKSMKDKLLAAKNRWMIDGKDPVNCSSHVHVQESYEIETVRQMKYKSGTQ